VLCLIHVDTVDEAPGIFSKILYGNAALIFTTIAAAARAFR